MLTRAVALIFIIFGLSVDAQGAEIFCLADVKTVEKKTTCQIAEFAGEIQDGDEAKFRKFLQDNPQLLYLDLDSAGGNLETAIGIGEQARANNLLTFIRDEDVCHSACFFIWFAGIYRSGEPGIHRPYVPGGLANKNIKDAEILYEKAKRMTLDYLAKIDTYNQLPETFVATMFATPPAEMRAFSMVPGLSPGITATFLPHIEQLLLDTCGSLKNSACLAETLLTNK